MSVCVVDGDAVTAYGTGLEACWSGLTAGRSAVAPFSRFSTEPFQCHCAAVLDELTYGGGESIAWQMLTKLLAENDPRVPGDAFVLLASTTGEVDLLEQAIDAGRPGGPESRLAALLEKVCSYLGGRRAGAVVSSACASATVALAQGAEMIERGEQECVLVVACDAVTEFVFSGFASLMALDPQGARPFDADRKGLSVGEAAGFILLMSAERAEREQRSALGTLAGWGMTNDANHMTGPSRDGGALARSIEKAFSRAKVSPESVAVVCAHGTGTKYNDSMELKAFKTVFSEPRPLLSVKGGTGHTMGAAGLLEALLSLRALKEKLIPPAIALQQPDEEAAGWISTEAVALKDNEWALSTNSGFGGVNAALVLRRADS